MSTNHTNLFEYIYITLSDSHTYIFTIHRCRVKHSWSFTIRKYHFKTSQCKPISKLNLQKSVHFHLHVLDACKITAYYSLLWCDVYSLSLIISPHITYASTVWDGCSGILSNKLNYLHSRRAAKLMISDSSLTTSDTKLQVLGLVPLKEKLMFNKAVLVFKAYTNFVPLYLKQLFICSNTCATSRFITLPKPRIYTFFETSFSFSGASLWNTAIPTQIKSFNSPLTASLRAQFLKWFRSTEFQCFKYPTPHTKTNQFLGLHACIVPQC